jgi:hypothetical protein
MRGIYVRPLLAAAPAWILTWFMRNWLPGITWPQLALAGCLCGAAYSVVAFFACLAPNHRMMVLARIPVVGAWLASRSR